MKFRFQFEALMCLLVGGGMYLFFTSARSAEQVARFVVDCLTERGPAMLGSPQSVLAVTALAVLGLVVLSRKSVKKAVR